VSENQEYYIKYNILDMQLLFLIIVVLLVAPLLIQAILLIMSLIATFFLSVVFPVWLVVVWIFNAVIVPLLPPLTYFLIHCIFPGTVIVGLAIVAHKLLMSIKQPFTRKKYSRSREKSSPKTGVRKPSNIRCNVKKR
jgi:hypothetical protein